MTDYCNVLKISFERNATIFKMFSENVLFLCLSSYSCVDGHDVMVWLLKTTSIHPVISKEMYIILKFHITLCRN